MHIYPLIATHKVIRNIGMDNSHIATINLGCILSFKCSCSLVDIIYCNLTVCIKCFSCTLATCKYCIVTAIDNFSCNGIKSHTCLCTEKLCGFHKCVINCSKLNDIRKCYIVTVLFNGCFNLGYFKALTIGCYTFNKRGCLFAKRLKLSEFDCLTTILGNGVFLSELIVNEFGHSVINKIIAVVGLHFYGKTCGTGCLCVQICEHLKIVLKI